MMLVTVLMMMVPIINLIITTIITIIIIILIIIIIIICFILSARTQNMFVVVLLFWKTGLLWMNINIVVPPKPVLSDITRSLSVCLCYVPAWNAMQPGPPNTTPPSLRS